MTPILSGRKVILRSVRLADAPCIQSRFPHCEIVQYLGDLVPWPYPPDGALLHLSNLILPAMEDGSEHHWAIELADGDPGLIGVVSLLPQDQSGNQRGFWISREHQGRGLMSEAVELVTQFAFDNLGMQCLELANAEPNVASIRLKQKQGAVLVSTEPGHFVSGPHPKQKWVLVKQTWRQTGPHEPDRGGC